MASKGIKALKNRLASVLGWIRSHASETQGGKIFHSQSPENGWANVRTSEQPELTKTQAAEITATWTLLNPP
jgi:hypothetical protein